MENKFNNYRTTVLSLNFGGMSDLQKDWLVKWVKENFTTPREIEKAAEIAWQYDVPDETVARIRALAV